MNIVGNKGIYLTISSVLVGIAVLAIVGYGFHEGIDFRGGTLWNLKFSSNNVQATDLEKFFGTELNTTDVRVTRDAQTGDYLVKLPAVGESDHKDLTDKLEAQYKDVQELSFQSIGPSVGAELKSNSMMAIALVLIGISLYIAFAFRKVYQPISSWKYGWVTLVTLFHDVAIPAGLLAILGHHGQVEVDGNFIVALLVVMGFSVHDTIVVFDRIRENLLLDRARSPFTKVVNDSVNQTLARSVNTSLTLILVLIALYVVGPKALTYFVLTLLVGVTTGIYSSIFVASPLLVVWHSWSAGQKAGAKK